MENNRLDNLRKFWDSMAEKFCNYEIPTFEDNEFMEFLKRENILNKNGIALDIGCGAGKYSLALSPYFKEIIGTDISLNMINGAKEKCQSEKIDNIEFMHASWQELDVDKFNWKDKFDFVFAHMTPALSDKETIQKLRYAAKNWCAVTKSVYRKSEIAEKVNDICGNVMNGYGENEQNELLSLLWAEGIAPQLFYEHTEWEDIQPKEKAAESYIKRMSVKKELSEKEKSEIVGYFNSVAVNDVVTEHTDVLQCTVYWREK